jgi:GntR family transcriptional repressor for pyruvate dehydrogenase complex
MTGWWYYQIKSIQDGKMDRFFEPVEVETLKEACIHQLERVIFSGEFTVGSQLPSERKLAEMLQVSRPILHQALSALELKGLVTIESRKGVFVNDYRKVGSIAMLASFLMYHQGELDDHFLTNLLEFRKLLEVETACLAAIHRKEEHLRSLKQIYNEEIHHKKGVPEGLIELDFSFHIQVAHASDNVIYPLILNAFKEVYINFTGRFFLHYQGSKVIDQVHAYHRSLIKNIGDKDDRQAGFTMIEMLEHGAQHLAESLNLTRIEDDRLEGETLT